MGLPVLLEVPWSSPSWKALDGMIATSSARLALKHIYDIEGDCTLCSTVQLAASVGQPWTAQARLFLWRSGSTLAEGRGRYHRDGAMGTPAREELGTVLGKRILSSWGRLGVEVGSGRWVQKENEEGFISFISFLVPCRGFGVHHWGYCSPGFCKSIVGTICSTVFARRARCKTGTAFRRDAGHCAVIWMMQSWFFDQLRRSDYLLRAGRQSRRRLKAMANIPPPLP